MTFYLDTEHPVALDSPDHTQPRATKNDNSTNPAFNRCLLALYEGRKPSVLDFGCAGGGMVRSLIWGDGCLAIGLEGSDYNLEFQQAEWPMIPENLFTCDLGYPFTLHNGDDEPHQFDVVTAWEFVEHIPQGRLPVMIQNMRKHLKKGGLVIGSTNDRESIVNGVEHHLTRKPIAWWIELFELSGFKRRVNLEQYFDGEGAWVRKVRDNFVFEKI
ncbi:MAG: class I SAM-dependent methyltransferase [Planctomycetota bacterium]|jgi:2-polyprenyl-3-methyl-5-hydroxy-6-metoxy-1,4-benzoquinol methylase